VRAFVTGATGFIGRRLVAQLITQGAEVTALVRGADHGLPDAVRTCRGDVLDRGSLQHAAPGFDRLYHLAALITFDPRRRQELMSVNGDGTANVLDMARHRGIARCVVVSSACTLGLSASPDELRDEESEPAVELVERNPYMASKIECEKAASAAAESHDVVVVNPTTVYGPGDVSLNSGALMQKVAGSVVLPVPPGGSNAVDVDDVVAGIIAAGERGQSGRRYALGGCNLRYRAIFATIASVIGRRVTLVPLPSCARIPLELAAWAAGRVTGNRFLTPQIIGDMFAFKYYDCSRAHSELDWQPQHTFDATVRRAWQFYVDAGLIRRQ